MAPCSPVGALWGVGSDTSWTGSGAMFPKLSLSLDFSSYKRKGIGEWAGGSLP